MVDIIKCSNCAAAGKIQLSFECEKITLVCDVCEGKGKLKPKKHYHQTWSEGVTDETTSIYYGPPLDPEGFKNYKIYGK
tara:strand:+ start:1005 stop:1241 length:237 start_codon:yes stop_codon:yes gene_type:complete